MRVICAAVFRPEKVKDPMLSGIKPDRRIVTGQDVHFGTKRWNKPAMELERRIRAYNPVPIAYTSFKGIDLRIWEAKVKMSEICLKTIILYICDFKRNQISSE